MEQGPGKVFTDDEVPPQVLSILRNAKKYAVIVTPYIKLWGHAKQAVEQATKRGVQVTVVLRDEDLEKVGEDVSWLQSKQVNLKVVDRLHSKLYFNETAMVMSSMNLVATSAQNSLEVAYKVDDPASAKRLREYVSTMIETQSKPIRALHTPKATREKRATYASATGVCIRCHTEVELDPDRPLCDDCYEEWAQYGNKDYPEHFCHACGKEYRTTYSQPLCGNCFWSSQPGVRHT